ncbi:peptidase T [Vagococcus vulneris]|uniref:Peptidase T n=1 Tax=Vagococcus vulneris TaxID=1977869 RepID=A0A429ZYN6_9ENTE|nr:peptidase T [Vagococcus vulneris]RST99099.1 peptidase T [Vagococcus vulneris]
MSKILERFLRYVKINTRSDANSLTIPTTSGQTELLLILQEELEQQGLSKIKYNTKNAFLTGCLTKNTENMIPAIGFIAHVDTADFPADFAYTVDSGRIGHFEYETFNAAKAILTISGTSVHPGTAYGMMVNALKIAYQIDSCLPQMDVPEHTKGYEGFYLLHDLSGTISCAQMTYIIRDHDQVLFAHRKNELKRIVAELNRQFDSPRISLEMKDQYYNMKEVIMQQMRCVDLALHTMKKNQIEPIITPFRGGTDGSKISLMGLPTPNIFTGGENFHGQYEFITLEAMELTANILIEIVKENVVFYNSCANIR